jgi:hypothetical protein
MIERDERPLSEICFSRDVDSPLGEADMRVVLSICGVRTGQDIVDMGCTGLVLAIKAYKDSLIASLAKAQQIRQSMAGSVCGLPCYVPDHLFCLVHNTVGGLQTSGNKDGPQSNPHPEGLALCSRPLTPEEGGKLQGMQAFAQAEAVKEANAHFGAEPVTEDDAFLHPGISPSSLEFYDAGKRDACPVPLPPFVCREHGEFTIGCRYCLAQSIVEGPVEPPMHLFAEPARGTQLLQRELRDLPALLSSTDTDVVELYVLAGRWVRKLVKE